jgi:hypothetical protein
MREFTHDEESTDLTEAECTAFAGLVTFSCHYSQQHKLSRWLACCRHEQPVSVCDFAQREARKLWRTEARL